MNGSNYACQVAKAQIGRYLSGERLTEDVLQQLEQHIAGCAECKASIRQKKEQLESQSPAEGSKPVRSGIKMNLAAAATAKGSFYKPLVWSLVLAGVLIAMSALARNPTMLFGPKAKASLKASEASAKEQNPGPEAPAKGSTTAKPEPVEIPKEAETETKSDLPVKSKAQERSAALEEPRGEVPRPGREVPRMAPEESTAATKSVANPVQPQAKPAPAKAVAPAPSPAKRSPERRKRVNRPARRRTNDSTRNASRIQESKGIRVYTSDGTPIQITSTQP